MHREEQLRLALASVPSRSWHAAAAAAAGKSLSLPLFPSGISVLGGLVTRSKNTEPDSSIHATAL